MKRFIRFRTYSLSCLIAIIVTVACMFSMTDNTYAEGKNINTREISTYLTIDSQYAVLYGFDYGKGDINTVPDLMKPYQYLTNPASADY